MTCIDSDFKRYSIDFNNEVEERESEPCAGFQYDLESRTITLPIILHIESIYVGSYFFEIVGANTLDTSIQSEGVVYSITINYKETNTGPALLQVP